jgi:hypothetical protein
VAESGIHAALEIAIPLNAKSKMNRAPNPNCIWLRTTQDNPIGMRPSRREVRRLGRVQGCQLDDPAAADNLIVLVEDRRLTGGDGALRFVKERERGGFVVLVRRPG